MIIVHLYMPFRWVSPVLLPSVTRREPPVEGEDSAYWLVATVLSSRFQYMAGESQVGQLIPRKAKCDRFLLGGIWGLGMWDKHLGYSTSNGVV